MPKTSHPLYGTWASMHARCENSNNPAYRNYGGRGITVCDRWADFDLFVADMGERPEGLTLDRVNNDGNYSPENCQWATQHDQKLKRRLRRTSKKSTACIYKQARRRFSVTLTLAPGIKVVNEVFPSFDEAKEFRDLLFYEREFTKALSH